MKKARNQIPRYVREYIVRRVARYEPKWFIAEQLKEQFGIQITGSELCKYDPDLASCHLGREMMALFTAERTAFLEKVEDIPIAQKSVRLSTLNRLAAKTEKQGNVALTAQIAEQAAKEMGGVYSNRQKVEVGGGDKPVEVVQANVRFDAREVLAKLEPEDVLRLSDIAAKLARARPEAGPDRD